MNIHGTVLKVDTCRYLKINQKPIRKHLPDGAAFPHIVTVAYMVNGKHYQRRVFLPHTLPPPPAGSTISLDADERNPKKITITKTDTLSGASFFDKALPRNTASLVKGRWHPQGDGGIASLVKGRWQNL